MAKKSGPARQRSTKAGSQSARRDKPGPSAKGGSAKGGAGSKPKASAPASTTPPRKPEAAPKPGSGAPGDKKPVRKGITIVAPKPPKKSKPRASSIVFPSVGAPLLGPGTPKRKPLIVSGPNAPSVGGSLAAAGASNEKRKPLFNKRDMARFRAILLQKRAELVGDVSNMETEALMSQSGSLSNLPQHMAEQGSDAYGQALALDLAAADRRLIKEIDDALLRIADGSYGYCQLTGKPIKPARLEELPWARYSIEAARELERRSRSV